MNKKIKKRWTNDWAMCAQTIIHVNVALSLLRSYVTNACIYTQGV